MIALLQMTPAEFDEYMEYALNDFTTDGREGTWPSAEVARAQIEKLLPAGQQSENQHLLSIRIEYSADAVGYIWLTFIDRPTGKEAFILDLLIKESFRRKGFGFKSLQSAETYSRERNVNRISLSVFPRNSAAMNLYRKAHYEPTSIRMSKEFA